VDVLSGPPHLVSGRARYRVRRRSGSPARHIAHPTGPSLGNVEVSTPGRHRDGPVAAPGGFQPGTPAPPTDAGGPPGARTLCSPGTDPRGPSSAPQSRGRWARPGPGAEAPQHRKCAETPSSGSLPHRTLPMPPPRPGLCGDHSPSPTGSGQGRVGQRSFPARIHALGVLPGAGGKAERSGDSSSSSVCGTRSGETSQSPGQRTGLQPLVSLSGMVETPRLQAKERSV